MSGVDPGYLDPARFAELRDRRAADPGAIASAHAARTTRPLLGESGRLFILAADHPARGALGVGEEPMAMADRYRLLDRLTLALSRPGVDGVLGTPDIIDDLALLGALDGKVVVGSMNRGGLRGAVFEMDDRYTAYDVAGIVRDRALDRSPVLAAVTEPGDQHDRHSAGAGAADVHAGSAHGGELVDVGRWPEYRGSLRDGAGRGDAGSATRRGRR